MPFLSVLAERPKIGLALSGGGAKGSAHIAVLALLEANNVPADFIAGNSKIFGAVTYQYNLGRSLLGLTEFPLYVGASLEAGNVWLTSDSVSADDLITAGTLFVSTDTRLGPVALGFGFAENDQNSVYFYLGKNI